MRVKAFRAWRPNPESAAEVACVPYDTVNREEAAALAEGLPNSFLHVIRPDIDLPPESTPEEQYAHARDMLASFVEKGWLVEEPDPCVYVYELTAGDHVQVGLVACVNVDDYRTDVIRKHEKTRPDKEEDRTRLILTQAAHTGPVFLTYRGTDTINGLVANALAQAPLFDVDAEDGVRHRVWRCDVPGEFEAAFDAVPVAYIADGHHRAAAAARAAENAGPGVHDAEESQWFLAVLFPSDQLKILAYNRVVAELNGLDQQAFAEEVRARFAVHDDGCRVPANPRQVCMYLGGNWSTIDLGEPESADPVSSLDVSLLQDKLLAPVLGIQDPRTDSRIAFVGGIRGTGELEQLVDTGDAQVAFSLYPVLVEQMMDISDADQIMPPKSTWFEPKLRSGLLVHPFGA